MCRYTPPLIIPCLDKITERNKLHLMADYWPPLPLPEDLYKVSCIAIDDDLCFAELLESVINHIIANDARNIF
jgi:hypothetical protein